MFTIVLITFVQGVRNRLRPLRKGTRANIFDNMLSMMEKYATRLETLVDERTQLLVEEKKKTDALLLEMLPRPVAEALKQVITISTRTINQQLAYLLFINLLDPWIFL